MLTPEQFQELLQTAGGARAANVGPAMAVGQLAPCALGRDKTKRFKKFVDWIKMAESKMTFLGIDDDVQKVNYRKSCAGAELLTFLEKEVRIWFQAVAVNAALGIIAAAAHTYDEVVAESRRVLLAIISRDRAVIDLLKISQEDRSVMEFLAEVEDQARLCRANENRITEDDLIRMTLIAGFRDRLLAEKVLAEEQTLVATIQLAVSRENSKANVEAMQAKNSEGVRRVGDLDKRDKESMEILDDDIQKMEERLAVMKIRQQGKFSGRYKGKDYQGYGAGQGEKCKNCSLSHISGECPAKGKTCFACEGSDHYARAPACKKNEDKKKKSRNRRVDDEDISESQDSDSSDDRDVRRIGKVSKRAYVLKKVNTDKTVKTKNRCVTLKVGGRKIKLYAD